MAGALPQLLGRVFGRLLLRAASTLTARRAVGARGEKVAAAYLRREGYTILERNFTTTLGEIDLIVFRDGVIAFVEVRSLMAPGMVDPLETVTRRKQQRVIRAAQQYAALHGLAEEDVELRFDVVSVLLQEGKRGGEVRHVVGAFGQSARLF